MLRELASFFADLKDVVSEPVRATIVRRFCRVMADKLQAQNKEALRYWLSRDQGRFIRECEIKDGLCAVPDDLEVTATALAKFCDHWISVSVFRTGTDSPWRPITPEMNSIRVTMIKQLRDIAAGKLDPSELTTGE